MVRNILVPGHFAVIHPGHVRLFKYAQTLGERIVVALDVTGADQNEIEWRIGALKGISLVDEVVTFEGNLTSLILDLRPAYVLKGLEFKDSVFAEAQTLTSIGGELVFSSGSYLFSNSREFKSELQVSGERVSLSDFLDRNDKTLGAIRNSLLSFKNKRVLVIGDTIVDEIIECQPVGLSAEAPALVATPIETKRFIGGAAIVAGHCSGLGSKVELISIRGDDGPGAWIEDELSTIGVSSKFFVDPNRKTTFKQKFKCGQQHLLRLNSLSSLSISASNQNLILSEILAKIDEIDAIIFSDFSYGTLTADLTNTIVNLAKSRGIFISADSQTSSQIGSLKKFRGVDLVTPTELEARQELRDDNSGLVRLVEDLRSEIGCKYVLLKLGAEGLLLHGIRDDHSFSKTDQIPSLSNRVVDTSGAGDSMLACSTLAFISGEDIYGAGLLGSIAAAVQISRIGNVPITSFDMEEMFDLL